LEGKAVADTAAQAPPKKATGPQGWQLQADGLGARARSGVRWGGASQAAQQGLSVVATLVLARLLSSADFGLIAAANSVLALGGLVLSLGFGLSILRRETLSREFVSTLFWTALGLGSIATCAMALASPAVSGLLDRPDARWYLAALAPTLTLNLVASIPLSLLHRELKFARYYGVQTIAMIVYVVVQVSLAFVGFGAWAVVIGQLSMAAVTCFGAAAAAAWHPSWRFSMGILRGETGYAGSFLLNRGLSFLVKNVDYWIVGATLGAAALGNYYIAFVLPGVLRLRASQVAETVLLPVFSRRWADSARVRSAYVQVARLQLGVGVPAMVSISLLADPIVHVAFGRTWGLAASPLQWLALAALLDFAMVGGTAAALANGRFRGVRVALTMRLAVIVPGVWVASLAWRSLEAVSLVILAATFVGVVTHQVCVARPLGLGLRLLRRDAIAIGVASATLAATVIVCARILGDPSDVARLLVCLPAGMLAYLAAGLLLFPSTFTPMLQSLGSTVLARQTRRSPERRQQNA